jgi:hypothetical protein
MSRPASKRKKVEANIHEKQGYARPFFMHAPSLLKKEKTGGKYTRKTRLCKTIFHACPVPP